MPTYDYKCDNCGHEFEAYQSMKDEKLTKCPSCSENTLKRLIGTGSGLIFKGSGFYLTDYKNKPAETTASPSSKKEKSAKTESTSAAADTVKPDTKTSAETTPKQAEKKETKVKSKKD